MNKIKLAYLIEPGNEQELNVSKQDEVMWIEHVMPLAIVFRVEMFCREFGILCYSLTPYFYERNINGQTILKKINTEERTQKKQFLFLDHSKV